MKAHGPGRLARCRVAPLLLVALVAGVAPARAADPPPGLAITGLATVPADAAFVFSTLRAREQWDRFANSNAFAALRGIPAVKRALESLEDQRSTPGSVPSLVTAALEQPENAQAVALLADMVATDTFVYGEPSCTTFVRLVRRLSAAAQAAGGMGDDEVIIEEEMDVFEEDLDGGEAAVRRPGRGLRCQFAPAMSPEGLQSRLLVQALVDNVDLLVVPDLVWGFRTTMPDAAKAQLARLEAAARAAGPDFADAVARKPVAGGDFLVLTLQGDALPWGDLEGEMGEEAGDIEGFDGLCERVRELDLCVAIGVVGDRVILSVGAGTDHLEKLVADRGDRLPGLPAFAPLVAQADKPLTTVWYVSAEMAKAFGQTSDDVRQQLEPLATLLEESGLPAEAAAEGRAVVDRFVEAIGPRMPEPGAWTAFSFLTDSGYEGYAWDWSRNSPLDGGRRLDLLEHVGGSPLAVAVTRLKGDPQTVDDVSALLTGLWSVFEDHGLASLDGEAGDRVREFVERFEPLWGRLADVVRGKLVAALADGQVGLVIDARARTKKPQRDLPASADPLPLPEPAILLPLADAKLFRAGLDELLAIGDDAVETLRELEPDAVPPDFQLPEPEESRAAGGTVWSFPVADAGLDEQLGPAIGVGDDVAVFTLAPAHTLRLLGAAKIETGSPLSTFEEPLAAAAAVDVAGLVDAVRPWIVYLTRYGCVREREGDVDADDELTADDETKQARDALEAVDVVLDVAKCLRTAAAETTVRDGAVVTHWRNLIRDLPKKP